MNFKMIPAAKRTELFGGTFDFDSLKIFTVGDGDSFTTALNTLLPDVKTGKVDRDNANVILSVAYAFSGKAEYCSIRILADHIEIHCRDKEGARNAACILAQVFINNRTRNSLPCGRIEDWPDASYRGMMIESSRAWTPMERLYDMLRWMALSRMNVMQFNFIEEPCCTIALDCYPDWPGFGEENLKYTKDEVRDMIDYADKLGISVCPFIEILSHAREFAKTADICCQGDTNPKSLFCVCIGQEKTYDAIEKVLKEVAELFPDPVIHIGCDEYDMSAVNPKTAYWDKCPHCQALAKKKGFTTLREQFLYAVNRINRIVNKLGKVSMLWNADLKPTAIPDWFERNIIVHFYRDDNPLGREKIKGLTIDGYIEDGFSVLNSNYRPTYLDDYMKSERLSHWGFASDPMVAPENMGGINGGCICIWAGYDGHEHYKQTAAPGIFLFADRLWNSFSTTTVYDEEFEKLLTTVMFEARLPEGMNVFEVIGDVLAPTQDGKGNFHPIQVLATPEKIEEIEKALNELGDDPMAQAYAKTAREAAEYRRKTLASSLEKDVKFEG